MKTFKLKVEKKQTEFVNINLPYYCRDKQHKASYFKIFSDDQFKGGLKVSERELDVVAPDLPFAVYGQEGLEEISEERFKKELQKTISELKKL